MFPRPGADFSCEQGTRSSDGMPKASRTPQPVWLRLGVASRSQAVFRFGLSPSARLRRLTSMRRRRKTVQGCWKRKPTVSFGWRSASSQSRLSVCWVGGDGDSVSAELTFKSGCCGKADQQLAGSLLPCHAWPASCLHSRSCLYVVCSVSRCAIDFLFGALFCLH